MRRASIQRQVKRQLRQAHVWRAYQRRWPRPFRLVLTRIAWSIDERVTSTALAPLEQALAARPTIDAALFQGQLAAVGKLTNFTCDWRALAQYLFLSYEHYQATTVTPAQAAQVRQAFYAWLHSVPLRTPRYNLLVQKVMREVMRA